jgi:hypothetical protein
MGWGHGLLQSVMPVFFPVRYPSPPPHVEGHPLIFRGGGRGARERNKFPSPTILLPMYQFLLHTYPLACSFFLLLFITPVLPRAWSDEPSDSFVFNCVLLLTPFLGSRKCTLYIYLSILHNKLFSKRKIDR